NFQYTAGCQEENSGRITATLWTSNSCLVFKRILLLLNFINFIQLPKTHVSALRRAIKTPFVANSEKTLGKVGKQVFLQK
ncbi:hypothetical protein LEMLEM_LOCUS18439, partial [Lemmus lemmus]